MRRTLVMGDVHGAYRAMIQALERAGFDPEKDQLIPLGDIADGWSEVPECVDYLLKCKNLIAIRGNHDDWAMEWLLYGNTKQIWIDHGGKATKQAYEEANMYPDFDMEAHKQFFKTQHNFYVDDQNRGFVHGGFVSRKGLGHEAVHTNYFWDRDLWQIALLSDSHYRKGGFDPDDLGPKPRFLQHEEIFIGHTPTLNWMVKPHLPEYKDPNQPKQGSIVVPMKRCNVWNLDTGGGFKGRVTVMDVDTKEYWQSDNVKTLYPNEAGRK